MRKNLFKYLLIGLLPLVAFGQNNKITRMDLMPSLVEFLYEQGDIPESRYEDYLTRKKEIELLGTINGSKEEVLNNGIYSFFVSSSHSKSYILVVENSDYKILDIDSADGLKEGVLYLIDFCNRSNYCVEITNECITRLLNIYYRVNSNPLRGNDKNCISGVADIKKMP